MNKSKILIFLLAILMIVSISAVSAADIADSDDLSQAQDDSAPLKVDEATDVQANDESTQSAETGNDLAPLQASIDDKGADELSVDKDVEKLSKGNSSVKIDPIENVTYGNPVVVNYDIKNRSSNVTVSICYDDGDRQPAVDGAVYVIGKENVTITNLTAGKYVIFIWNNEDGNFTGNSSEAFFSVTKATPMFDVKAYVDEFGIIEVNVTTNKTATGEIGFKIDNGQVMPYPILNGTVNFAELTKYDKGIHNVTVIYKGDDNYKNASYNDTVTVEKDVPVIENMTAVVNEYGHIVVNANITKGATGNVILLFINPDDPDKNITVPIPIGENGTIEYSELEPFAKGYYNVQIGYDGDGNYYAIAENAQADVNVTKTAPVIENITAVVDQYGDIVVNANITKGATGNVTFLFINRGTDENMTVPIEIGANGTIEYSELKPFAKGQYGVYISYDGDANYYAAHAQANDDVEVKKFAPVLEVELGTIEGNITINVTATNNTVNGPVNITIFDKDGNLVRNVTKEMFNGVVEEFNLTGFAPNDYKVRADFLGSDYFYMAFAENVAKVREQVDMNVTVSVNEYGQIVAVANFTKNATGIVEFTVKNATGAIIGYFNATIVNGTAQFETRDVLPKGNYTAVAYYFGDDYYKDIEVMGDKNATIAKEYLEVTPKVTVEGNQANIVFTFSGNATGNATAFFLSYGSNATFAIKNGKVVIDEIFDNGEQSVLLTYDGDDKYYGFYDVYADFYVKASSFIKVNPVTVVYQNTAKVTVTLTDNNDGKGNNPIANAEIVITLNGKTYKGTTDAKGVATISIPANLVPKAYTAKVSYAGTNVTVGDAENLKFTVKKATPKVTAKKKTFKKSKKVKKYTITLKDNKGKAIKKAKVTIKVGKKTFKATTNAKGKAVFKLKKLTKKAKYNAKITYKGNKYFNKVTKKVKITIK